MKLYTEEQVISMIDSMGQFTDEQIEYFVSELTPIELPSDEEIKKMMELDGMEFDEFDPYDVSYLGGATWMRNKIQGGKE
jgi:hypothetical protein